LHATKRVMVSVDFAEIEALQHQVNGQKPWKFYLLQLSRLKQHVLIFFNLYQYCAQISITSSGVLNIPLLHIADATGAQLITDNLNTIGLPGKKFTVQ